MDPGLEEVSELRVSEEVRIWRPGGSNERKGDCSRVHSTLICGYSRLDDIRFKSLKFKWPFTPGEGLAIDPE